MAVQFGGLASGLDTQALIRAILEAEREPVNRLQQKRSVFDQQKSALNELTGKIDSFESALRQLSSSSNFRARTVTLSSEGAFRATASSGAESGVFQIDVTTLAAASKVASDGVAEPDQALVDDGQIVIQSGSNDAITIDVSSSAGNNTLEQVRDAINAADSGVQASIVNDGTNYRLTVRATETGLANALTITDGTNLGLDDPLNEVTPAADAALEVDGIAVTSSDNSISGVIEGVVLDLITTTGTPVSVEIAQDDDKVVENVEKLVSAYNDVINFIGEQTSRDNPGPLANDPTLRGVRNQLQTLFTSGLPGIPLGGIRSLASIGVSFDARTSETSLDTAKLRELLETNFDDVGNLFLTSGSSTDPRIQFLLSTTDSVPGTYDVTVTQAAEKASVLGRRAINANGINQDEQLTIDNGSGTLNVQLTSGQTIDQIVSTLNTAFADNDFAATVVDDNGVLRISGTSYGSASEITVTSDRATAPPNGFGSGFTTTPSFDQGLDVEGTIGGAAATGSGQVLTAAEDGDYAGLQLRVTATAAQVTETGGDFGSLSFSRGLVPTILERVDRFTRFGDGDLERATDAIDSRIELIDDDISRREERLAARETRLLRTFAAAERAIQALQNQQSIFSVG